MKVIVCKWTDKLAMMVNKPIWYSSAFYALCDISQSKVSVLAKQPRLLWINLSFLFFYSEDSWAMQTFYYSDGPQLKHTKESCITCVELLTSIIVIGGSRGMPGACPLRDPILLFLHAFLAKSAHIRGPCPSNRSMCPPTGPRPPPTGNPGSATDCVQSSQNPT